MDNLRIVEVLRGDVWERIQFEELVKGDTFKMFDLTPVRGAGGVDVFQAASDPRTTEEGFLTIDIEYQDVTVVPEDQVIDMVVTDEEENGEK